MDDLDSSTLFPEYKFFENLMFKEHNNTPATMQGSQYKFFNSVLDYKFLLKEHNNTPSTMQGSQSIDDANSWIYVFQNGYLMWETNVRECYHHRYGRNRNWKTKPVAKACCFQIPNIDGLEKTTQILIGKWCYGTLVNAMLLYRKALAALC